MTITGSNVKPVITSNPKTSMSNIRHFVMPHYPMHIPLYIEEYLNNFKTIEPPLIITKNNETTT